MITTDVIDLAGDGLLGEAAAVSRLAVEVDATTSASSKAAVEVRTGTTFFQAPGTWTDWRPVKEGESLRPAGRYAQVRLVLTTGAPRSARPRVRSLRLVCRRRRAVFPGEVSLIVDRVQRIGRSPVRFGYERPDQADLVWLRKTFKLDQVIAGRKTEFEKLRALMHWVATRPNKRPRGWRGGGPYPWNIRKVLKEENGGTIYGHCMSYCEVFITAALGGGTGRPDPVFRGDVRTLVETIEGLYATLRSPS